MTLKEYLKASGISQAAFAVRIGVGQSSLSKICAGVIMPSLETAVRIEDETRGQVPASSWVRGSAPDGSANPPQPTSSQEDAA